jgi:hypothetical protein
MSGFLVRYSHNQESGQKPVFFVKAMKGKEFEAAVVERFGLLSV